MITFLKKLDVDMLPQVVHIYPAVDAGMPLGQSWLMSFMGKAKCLYRIYFGQ